MEEEKEEDSNDKNEINRQDQLPVSARRGAGVVHLIVCCGVI